MQTRGFLESYSPPGALLGEKASLTARRHSKSLRLNHLYTSRSALSSGRSFPASSIRAGSLGQEVGRHRRLPHLPRPRLIHADFHLQAAERLRIRRHRFAFFVVVNAICVVV